MEASQPAPGTHRPRPLSITRRNTDGTTVLTVIGEIDEDTDSQFRQALFPSGGQPAARTVLDLSQVTFMDSTGINALVAAHHALPDNGWLRLAGATGIVWRVIELVGLQQAIACYPTVEKALQT